MKNKLIFLFLLLSFTLSLGAENSSWAFGRRKPAPEETTPVVCQESTTERSQVTAVSRVIQTNEGRTQLFSLDANKKEVALQTGDVALHLGANLSTCLLNGNSGFLAIKSEPDYAQVFRWLDKKSTNPDSSQYEFKPVGLTVKTTETVAIKKCGKKPAQETVLSSRSELVMNNLFASEATNLCTIPFEGTVCLDEMSKELFKTDFLARYDIVLNEMMQMNLSPEIKGRLAAIRFKANTVKTLLEKKYSSDFMNSGYFFAANFKNSPTLFCQLASRSIGPAQSQPPSFKDDSLNAALYENEQELSNSILFLEKLNQN